ncbi:hypothetical protein Tco_1321037 [Tanacetum coccineum]
MENENPVRTLGDYSRPSHEGYRNTIELPDGNNVVPLRSDTIRLVQNECSFHGLWSEDPNQHLKDFLKLMDSLDLDVANRGRTRLRLFQFSLRDQASNWLERLPVGSISTWEDLTTLILIGSIPIEVPVAPEVGVAAVASPVGVLELDTHSSLEVDPSKSSPPPVSVAPMVSPFLCSDDSESETEIPERNVSPTPHDAMLTRWRSCHTPPRRKREV